MCIACFLWSILVHLDQKNQEQEATRISIQETTKDINT